MVSGDRRPRIPAATMSRPHTADRLIGRPDLLARLRATAGGGLVTLTAPAGYGKTTAAAQWDDDDPRAFAWVRIDDADNDPGHLLAHLAAALGADGDELQGPAPTHPIPAASGLLEDRPTSVVVFDDVQNLSAPEAVAVLRAVIDAAPPTVTTALLGRSLPEVRLARRRLDRDVVEIDAEALRLTDEQAAAILASVHPACDAATTAAVVARCEGWAAGVVLMATAARDGILVDALTRRNPVADYLAQEVLEQLDADTAAFLIESAVLQRFTAQRLDAVLGRNDSEGMLERLTDAGNMVVVPLDPERRWYRHHHLFSDVLRTRLRTTTPDRYRQVASRAVDLLEGVGDIDAALMLALDAGDHARCAALVGRDAVRLCFDGRAGVLARRVALLDERTVAEYPDAAVARAWLGVITADAEAIQRSLLLAHRGDRGRPLADGTPSVKIAAALIGSIVGVGGVRDVIRFADLVRAAGDNLVNPWWGAATVMKGAAESMLGHADRARVLLESALPVIEDLPGFHAVALAHLGLLDLAAGDEDLAIERSYLARKLTDKYELSDVVPMVAVYATAAAVSAHVGDVTSARDSTAITEGLLNRLGPLAARTALLGHGLLAWTAAVIADRDLVRRHLDAAERARVREPDAPALAQRVERVKAMVAGRSSPLTAAELRLLPHLSTHLSLQRIAETLLIGRETAKSQTASIYRKLGVSSRCDAVAEAKRIGLLPD
ncbi:LuxR family transcriptional regulator [Mycolicibacterium duvalii]|nr:LuxR family transcriptional regulator [Mycolicibacterium duvalii]PEG39913.1 LuxR family transcriptional regulator [Mycolicibacterium duvalii]